MIPRILGVILKPLLLLEILKMVICEIAFQKFFNRFLRRIYSSNQQETLFIIWNRHRNKAGNFGAKNFTIKVQKLTSLQKTCNGVINFDELRSPNEEICKKEKIILKEEKIDHFKPFLIIIKEYPPNEFFEV
jgi:hypothetical protein